MKKLIIKISDWWFDLSEKRREAKLFTSYRRLCMEHFPEATWVEVGDQYHWTGSKIYSLYVYIDRELNSLDKAVMAGLVKASLEAYTGEQIPVIYIQTPDYVIMARLCDGELITEVVITCVN